MRPNSIQHKGTWPTHIIAALKGISALDEQTAKKGSVAEERYQKSYPFHPELTEVFYSKWSSGIERFQKTRGVLRTFALALREAVKWDESPLVGPAVFLSAPKTQGLSEAARELVSIADTIVSDGAATRWTGILETELECARQVEQESVGLKLREIEQAAMATFLHSQPTGRSAKTRDLMLLVGPCRPDKIEYEKGLMRWARKSYWLDDQNLPTKEGELPSDWKLGNRPNLNQMQSAAAATIDDAIVKARLEEDIRNLKALTAGASAAGVKVHTLPTKPKDIEDDGLFHYAVMPPSAASESGKPSSEAKRFLDETTGSNKPRVHRNAVILLTPSRDGLTAAEARVRDAMAWQLVRDELTPTTDEEKQQKGAIDVARMQTLKINIDKAREKVPDAIRQAYCIVVTVSEKDEPHAFKLSISDQNHFETIKSDPRSRVRDTAITADALLPDGPYNLWQDGDKSRRVKDLAGAFAQLPHLPKMLKSSAIVETLVEGCLQGSFVLKVTRPDRSFRTWWRDRPDEAALADPSLELVLPEHAELADVLAKLLSSGSLPGLWAGEEITAQSLLDYFNGKHTVEVDRGSYKESVNVPKASQEAIELAIRNAVAAGHVWLLSGPSSLWAEEVPQGILTPAAKLRVPPDNIAPAALLPATLPNAWKNDSTNAAAIATALSHQSGLTLPWKNVASAISAALTGRFLSLSDDSGDWPCDFAMASKAKFTIVKSAGGSATGGDPAGGGYQGPSGLGLGSVSEQHGVRAVSQLEAFELQELGEAVATLLEIKNKCDAPLTFSIQIDFGDAQHKPAPEIVTEMNECLGNIKDGLELT